MTDTDDTGPLRLAIRHVTSYAYDPPLNGMTMRLRLWPSSFASQTVESWSVYVGGQPVSPNVTDGCGVQEGIFVRDERTATLEAVAEGVVVRQDDQGVLRGLKERTPPELFLRTTPLTTPDDRLRDLAEDARREDGLSTLHALSGAVRDAIAYEPGATNMATSAAAALSQGMGVCQDHAHVFIAAARAVGLPARYVAGYYMASGDGDGSDATELFETHGWAEAHVDRLGWVGFDVSNRTCPTREHVRVACHLDAGRVALISGALDGHAEETLTASVRMSQAQQ